MSRIIGYFDGVEGTRASGWAADADAPDRVLGVVLCRLGPEGKTEPLWTARANRPREDLRAAGLENVHHGFEWRVPYSTTPYRLVAIVEQTGDVLPGGPAEIAPRVFYEGTLDGVEHGVLRGWARAWDPSVTASIEIFIDGKRRGTTQARTERPDIAIAQIGTGRHGFAWIIPEDVADGRPHEFACRVAGSSEWLDGSPKTVTIGPGDRSLGLDEARILRGFGQRPPIRPLAPPDQPERREQEPSLRDRLARLLPLWKAFAGAGQGSGREASRRAHQPAILQPALPAEAEPGLEQHQVRLLIPVWGNEYIATFCRTALPSLLSPNNLPFLARAHLLTVVFLTRRSDRKLFEDQLSFHRLRAAIPVVFTDIDDVLEKYFDPGPHAYAMALTYAYFRGIQEIGERACVTDFLFWNADFIAADGTFRTLAELIGAGVRCTYAPSLRVDLAVEEAVLAGRRSDDGTVLDIGPREWVTLASNFRHPTVMAQTVNRYEERMIDTTNQLYWQVDDGLMVGRVFLMFMLHIRPERVWPELYGHCDYVFVPEMVPSSEYHFETHSDRVLIIELQHYNREWQDIVYGDAAVTPAEVARGVGRWTTREHRMAGRHMVVFNSAEPGDLGPARALTDAFMEEVYRQLPAQPVWHNGHFFWTQSLELLGLRYEEPGPDHPRSHLAAALRWSGYDIDILRESWPDPGGAPADLFDVPLPLRRDFDAAAWLGSVQHRYLECWREADWRGLAAVAEYDLIAGNFHGLGWGLVEPCASGWVRRLGPDGSAVLLLRLPKGRAARLWLFAGGDPEDWDRLRLSLNGRPARAVSTQPVRGASSAITAPRVDISGPTAAQHGGRVELILRDDAASAAGTAPLAFAGLALRLR